MEEGKHVLTIRKILISNKGFKDTMAQFGLCSIHPALFKDYILHFGSEANKSFAGSLGG